MANLLHRQEMEVEVEFYSFALQEADDNLVPSPFPEGSESGNFLSFLERRIDIESGGHTHTASLAAEVWDSEPRQDPNGDWAAEGEGPHKPAHATHVSLIPATHPATHRVRNDRRGFKTALAIAIPAVIGVRPSTQCCSP
ncbi:hypothetical protein ACIQU1_08765 [Streptomyces angustmyceticus]|uniref:hypothetical protein n=1 Tax=Streptomyces angustmyceticus TaxID=285578 RepID=UPI0037F26461